MGSPGPFFGAPCPLKAPGGLSYPGGGPGDAECSRNASLSQLTHVSQVSRVKFLVFHTFRTRVFLTFRTVRFSSSRVPPSLPKG